MARNTPSQTGGLSSTTLNIHAPLDQEPTVTARGAYAKFALEWDETVTVLSDPEAGILGMVCAALQKWSSKMLSLGP